MIYKDYIGRKKVNYQWCWGIFEKGKEESFGPLDFYGHMDEVYEPEDADSEEYNLSLELRQIFYTDDYGTIDEETYHLNVDTWEFEPPLPTKYLQKYFDKNITWIKKITNLITY